MQKKFIRSHFFTWQWFGVFSALLVITQGLTLLIQTVYRDQTVINDAVIFGWVTHPLGVAAVAVIGLGILMRLAVGSVTPLSGWGITLALVGGLSNIIDRFIWGGAVDYLPLFSWSTFNLADIEIVTGAIILLFLAKSHQQKSAA